MRAEYIFGARVCRCGNRINGNFTECGRCHTQRLVTAARLEGYKLGQQEAQQAGYQRGWVDGWDAAMAALEAGGARQNGRKGKAARCVQ
jgi:hypothetical protein